MKRRVLRIFSKRNLIVATIMVVVVTVSFRSEPEETMEHDLTYLRRNRNLQSYLDDIEDILIQPRITPCQDQDIHLVALVCSAPSHLEQRIAIRSTWGTTQPTYFFLGVTQNDTEEQMKQNYMESVKYDDLIITNLMDNYDNLTLKTSLMLSWTLKFCSHARFVLKVDDDVLVNPWTLKTVLEDHANDSIIGLRYEGHPSIRDQNNKWYLPEWLFPSDIIPEFLGGPAYIIRGTFLPELFKTALDVPLINIEDVFYTYLVAKKTLGVNLTHDDRIHSYYPKLALACSYWPLATVHRQNAATITRIFPKLQNLAHIYSNNIDGCSLWNIVVNII